MPLQNSPSDPISQTTPNPDRLAAAILAVGSVVTAPLMPFHPHLHAPDFAGWVQRLADTAPQNAAVHGSIMLAFLLVMFGHSRLCQRLGPTRMPVIAGALAFLLGSLAGFGAASIDGFILPNIAIRQASNEPQQMEAIMRPAVAIGVEVIKTLSRGMVVLLCTAVICWSVAILRGPWGSRALGITGLVAGILPLTALALGRLPMNMHGVGVFLLLLTIFNLAVAVRLWRRA